MPIIYGKTSFSMVSDIRLAYGPLLSGNDTYPFLKMINHFFSERYPDILNFMKLITQLVYF